MLQGYVESNPYRKTGQVVQTAPQATSSTGGYTTFFAPSNGILSSRCEGTEGTQGTTSIVSKGQPQPQATVMNTRTLTVEGQHAEDWLMKEVNKFADWVENTKAGRSSAKTRECVKAFRDLDTIVALAARHRIPFGFNPETTVVGFLQQFGWEKGDFSDEEWKYILQCISTYLRFIIDEILEYKA